MKKYEYVPVKFNNNVVTNAETAAHRQIIDEYAAKGYRFVCYIPTFIGPSGKILQMDLVFETEE